MGPTARLIGGLPHEHPDRARAASPLSYITDDAPPFQISHGTADQLVPHPHSELLHSALVNAGVSSELYLVHDFRHGFLNPPDRSDVNTDTVLDNGRLDAAGHTAATYRTGANASADSETTFGFDTIGDFLVRHLIEGAS
jgi:acetyl esterase/lipase